MTITRTLVAALAIAALAASTASARPLDDIHEGLVETSVNAPGATAADSATDGVVEDLRHLRAGGSLELRRPVAGPPTWPVDPEPLTPPTTVASTEDDGVDWAQLALGSAAGFVAIGGVAAGVAGGRRRQRRRAIA